MVELCAPKVAATANATFEKDVINVLPPKNERLICAKSYCNGQRHLCEGCDQCSAPQKW